MSLQKLSQVAGRIYVPGTSNPSGVGESEGDLFVHTSNDTLSVYSGSAWVEAASYGSFKTFTPTCTQGGSVTLTTAIGRYQVGGKRCLLHISLDFGGTGTGGNAITIGDIPSAIAPRVSGDPASGTADLDVGAGYYYDPGVALYMCLAHFATSSTIRMVANTSGFLLGVNPATAIATADSLNLTIAYELA